LIGTRCASLNRLSIDFIFNSSFRWFPRSRAGTQSPAAPVAHPHRRSGASHIPTLERGTINRLKWINFMKITLTYLLAFSLAFLSQISFAEQKYNPHTGTWETTTPDAKLQYNPHSNSWKYSAPNSSPQYNPHNNSWDMAPKGSVQKYNPHERTWETTQPDEELKYNPHTNSWKYAPKKSNLEYNPHKNQWEYPD